METYVTKLPEMRLICVRHIGKYPEIGSKFEVLMPHCAAKGIRFTESLALFLDDPESMPSNELRSDAAVVVSGDIAVPDEAENPADGEIYGRIIPASDYFSTRYVGSYSGLEAHWGEFYRAFLASGHRASAMPEIEIYKNDCSVVPEEQLVTELYIPIESAT